MKAALAERYGPPEVVEVKEVPMPVPAEGDILIKVHATTVSSGDVRLRSFNVPCAYWIPFRLATGLFTPNNPILGVEFAGAIEALGKGVDKFKVGDKVYGYNINGCHAEYKCMPADKAVALKPVNMSYEEAAAVPHGGLAALHFLRKAKVQRGHKVLINGASGAVGIIAVQLAKHFGAEVTGVCSTNHVEQVKLLGSDRVVDYTQEDFLENGEVYDIIFDTVSITGLYGCRNSLAPNGTLIVLITSPLQMVQWLWTSFARGKKIIGGVAAERAQDLIFLKRLVEAGEIKTVIDRTYLIEQIVEAHAYVDKGHKIGNVVIALAH